MPLTSKTGSSRFVKRISSRCVFTKAAGGRFRRFRGSDILPPWRKPQTGNPGKALRPQKGPHRVYQLRPGCDLHQVQGKRIFRNQRCRGKIGMPEAGGIIHSFSGSVEVAELLIPHGISFSLGGILTYRNSKKRVKLLQRIYPDYFLLETDSPDIPPVQMEKPNVPANIIYNLKAAAEIVEKSEDEVAKATTQNAIGLFGL